MKASTAPGLAGGDSATTSTTVRKSFSFTTVAFAEKQPTADSPERLKTRSQIPQGPCFWSSDMGLGDLLCAAFVPLVSAALRPLVLGVPELLWRGRTVCPEAIVEPSLVG